MPVTLLWNSTGSETWNFTIKTTYFVFTIYYTYLLFKLLSVCNYAKGHPKWSQTHNFKGTGTTLLKCKGWMDVNTFPHPGLSSVYLSLCELCELGHCQLHLALLRARGWCWGLWLNLLRGCSRTCDGFLPSAGRSCAGTRNCRWDRLTPDYLSHHLLCLTCKRRIWAKNHIFSFLTISPANLQDTNCNGVWWWSNRWSKHCQFAHKFSLQTICVIDWKMSAKCFLF